MTPIGNLVEPREKGFHADEPQRTLHLLARALRRQRVSDGTRQRAERQIRALREEEPLFIRGERRAATRERPKPRKGAQKRRLARARRARDEKRFSLRERKRAALQKLRAVGQGDAKSLHVEAA